ncbi:unnamed protein product [Closterium sp. Yama58-4]|nr:unnamed protein product [Closterium sp. Yama58-4]
MVTESGYARLLLFAAALTAAGAAACSLPTANLPLPRRDAHRLSQQRLRGLSRLARPTRARRSLLKLDAATGGAADAGSKTTGASAAKPVVLEGSQCAGYVNLLLSPRCKEAVRALVQLQEAWGAWAGNSNATTACSAWAGVTCSPNGLVLALDAKQFSEVDPPPSGTIPASITSLATLQYLDLTYIDLVGSIPSLASLTRLTHLAIGVAGSRLTGTLDGLAWLSSLTNLQSLYALPARHPANTYLEAFTGDLSSLHIVSHMRNLQQLTLASLTNATGEIPREIRYLTALTSLDLSFLRALEFPDWVTHLSNLEYLNVETDDPRRQGVVIDAFSELTALTSLTFSGNNLEGYLPKSWSALVNLQELLTSGLHVVAQMTWLANILLDSNDFSGVLPASFTAIKSLAFLLLNNNHFTGTFPHSILFHTSLLQLDLSNNSFTGSIPHELTNLVNLQNINLNDNNFRGAIPSGLFQLSTLSSLQVSNNFLSGGLPRTLNAHSSLHTLFHPPEFFHSLPLHRAATCRKWLHGLLAKLLSLESQLCTDRSQQQQLHGVYSRLHLHPYHSRCHVSLLGSQRALQHKSIILLSSEHSRLLCPNSILWHGVCGAAAGSMVSNNYLYGPLPDCLFDKCINQIDVSGNSLYGRINRNFKSMVADSDALINLAHNFFFGDALLLAAGCQVCPTQITEPNNLGMGDTFDVLAGKCTTAAATGLRDISVAGAGKEARVGVAGNCLTLSADAECSANATQRSTAACQAFCSITDNGPCDGHGECVPPAPASPSNFTCLCHAGYSALDLGNGSTCAVVNSTSTTVSSLSTGAIVGIALLTGSRPIRYESHIRNWAMQKMEAYALDELKDSKLEASEEATVAFADLALDCVKMPGTRRPDMKAVAHSLSTLIDKFCPDKEPCEFVENLSFPGSESAQTRALSRRSPASSSINNSLMITNHAKLIPGPMHAAALSINVPTFCAPPAPPAPPSDVSGNSLYGRINRNFKSMVADSDALINLAHNFFFGDALLLAAGCQVCPTQITEPNNLGMGDTFDVLAGKCTTAAATGLRDISVAGAGKEARVGVAGNCLTLSADAECSANATQRSTAACQAFCSITDNGPCDGHGECVPPAPASPSNFTCLCHAGYSALDLGNGSTCAVVNSTSTTVSSLSTGAIVGIAVGCFAGFVLLAAVLTWLLRPRGPKKWQGLEVCEQYTLQQVAKATNNWSEENELGSGGFGVVYKGYSPQGQLWAIKRSTVMTNDFELEVRAMATLHHVNLVRLLGFCVDQNVETGKQEQILVYEYVGNKDLEHHIYKARYPLSLRQRLRLAQGAAEGLAYLHGFATPIIHRDIKPANILVTADMQAKVADFGLLKRLTHGEGDATKVAGTPGYVDPDYNRTNVLTTKCDVFSFGIVLLELLTGSRPIRYESHIRNWAMQKMEAYALDELKDSKLEASEEATVAFADLALDCVKMPGTRRPDMKAVAHSLSTLIDKFCPDKEPCEFVENLSFPGSESAQTRALSRRSPASSSINNSGGSSSGLGTTFRGLSSWAQFRLSGRY